MRVSFAGVELKEIMRHPIFFLQQSNSEEVGIIIWFYKNI